MRAARARRVLAGRHLPYAEMRDTVPALVREVHESAGPDRADRQRPQGLRPARGRFRRGARSSLNDAVERALRLLAHRDPDRGPPVRASRWRPDVPALEGDAQHVEQVVVNLVINALEALPDRDRAVRVSARSTARRPLPSWRCATRASASRPSIWRAVRPVLHHQAASSGGTGLGLAITASLVRAARRAGSRFSSEPGRGTCATVRLPISGAGDAGAPEDASIGGSWRTSPSCRSSWSTTSRSSCAAPASCSRGAGIPEVLTLDDSRAVMAVHGRARRGCARARPHDAARPRPVAPGAAGQPTIPTCRSS